MGNILGLDLGTNSLGWAIRDTDVLEDDQIVDYGVVIFKKGVGEGKSGEYSLAAERRKNRSKRRLYNAKRYRKWATLKVLQQNGMCPISEEELRLWSIGNWQDGKNKGRVYPSSPDFHSWLAMDFNIIGKERSEQYKHNPEYANPYLLRKHLIETPLLNDENKLIKIGRSLYHLVQRRGFKTSRKNGKSTYGENEYLKTIREKHPEWHASQILQYGLENENRRIRNSGVIQRIEFEKEFYQICKNQGLQEVLIDKLYKAIYFVRPLRTQKGLVGTCTLEQGKPRIPTSHPAYEEFRALAFINSIQRRESGTSDKFEAIPVEVKREILEKLFFKRSSRSGKVSDRTYFKFDEIIDAFSENGKWEFNYKNKPNVTTCPVTAGLMNVFDDEWKNKFLNDGDKFGINWAGLKLNYKVIYGKKSGAARSLGYEEIWHLLFDYIQTKDRENELKSFCLKVLGFDEEKANEFIEIDIQQGYGSLSKTAIDKINPFLRQGFIYSEAVSFANLSKVLGNGAFEKQKGEITKEIATCIKTVDELKERYNIINALIQQFFADNNINRAKGVDNIIKELAFEEVERKLIQHYGQSGWQKKNEKDKEDILNFVLDKYLRFLDGKQDKYEKASALNNKNPELDYYKLPRLDEAIKLLLKNKFGASEAGLKKLYHPSDIDTYPKSRSERLEDPNPPSKGWKNPMAMRTMHELRKLVNHLLESGKIDKDTKVVVEMARELNDANKRWAIQTYQKRREEQNIEFAKAILGVAREKFPNLNENDAENIDRVRLWWEQLENGDELYKEIKALKEDVKKYKLWKEQQCVCLYTGKLIKLTDLFDGTSFDFEHTFPISDSFDNSLSNLTICDATFNRTIKKDKIPTKLENYDKDWNGYTAIEPRLQSWKEKVKNLKKLIDDNKIRSKKAQDPESKANLIKARHLLQFDLEYWDKKLKTFTLKEMPNWWKNSQLVDTQIISKYARAYLKTVFNKVDVQKGSVTSDFRKIFGIMGDEKKDRNKHSHHAKDAAVLTLIPGSARRDDILKKYYEDARNFRTVPYSKFNISHVQKIEDEVLVNHVTKDQTLNPTRKKVRKRGKVVYLRDKISGKPLLDQNGKKIPLIMQGDAIRGALHKETYFGAIKVVERNEEGFAIKENGKYVVKQKDGEDEIWIVVRKPINDVNIDKDIVADEVLKNFIKQQIERGKQMHEVVDFNNKPIRHLRCRVKAGVGYLSKEKALPIKKHIFESKYEHKKEYLVQNEENYLFLLYEGFDRSGKIVRGFNILNLFDIASLKLKSISDLKNEQEFQYFTKGKGKNEARLKLKAIIKVGDKVIFYDKCLEEIQDLEKSDIVKRIFTVYKFNVVTPTGYLYCQNHLEARPSNELKDGDTIFDSAKYQARLKVSADNFNCAIENVDFEISPDGIISWIEKKNSTEKVHV